MKVQTADFQKLAEKVGKAPAKYATPEEVVRSTGLFRGQILQQYAIDYVNCTAPLVFNKNCTVLTALRKSFLKAFHAYSDDHVRRYGCHLQIEDHIVNYDTTLTKMTRGHILDPNQVITPIVSTTTLTTNTGPKAKVSLKDSVVVVNLSRAALSATLPSSNVVRENLRPSCLINSVFNSTSVPQINTSVVNIARYDTIVDTGASAHVVKSTQLATNVRTVTNRRVALGDNSIKLSITNTCEIGILTDVMVVPNITLNHISGPRLDIPLGFSMRFANGRGPIRRGRHFIRCILKDGLYYCNLKDFLQPQECTEYSNLVQPNSKSPMIELAGAPLPTVTERLITLVSKPNFKPQRTLST